MMSDVTLDHLYGLVRVPSYRSSDPGFDFRRYQILPSSSGSATGSTKPCEDKDGAILKEKVAAPV
jgi:hypothetical protein